MPLYLSGNLFFMVPRESRNTRTADPERLPQHSEAASPCESRSNLSAIATLPWGTLRANRLPLSLAQGFEYVFVRRAAERALRRPA
jgi:hypothetical protein